MRSTPCPLCDADDARPAAVTPPHLAPDRGERFRFVRCCECRLVYLNPRPGPDELERYYGPGYLPHRGPDAWGRWAPLVRGARRRLDRRRVREARRALEAPDGARDRDGRAAAVLDVGCGRPTFLRTLGEETGVRGVGVDTSDAGWRDDPDAFDGVELHVGTVETVHPGRRFDLITLWHVLEHAYRPRPFLRRLRSWCRPGGRLLVEVPDHGSLPRRLQGPSWIGYDAPRHAAVYTPNTLRRILRETGWLDVEIRPRATMDPWVLWWLGRQVARGRDLRGPLEDDFLPFVAGKVVTWPLALLGRWLRPGAILARARAPARPTEGATDPEGGAPV